MTLQLIVSREARADISEAVTWLRDISPSLPPRFREELESVYAAVVERPLMYATFYKRFRRALLRRFPYAVFYILESSAVLIVAVLHQSRDESVWKRRA